MQVKVYYIVAERLMSTPGAHSRGDMAEAAMIGGPVIKLTLERVAKFFTREDCEEHASRLPQSGVTYRVVECNEDMSEQHPSHRSE